MKLKFRRCGEKHVIHVDPSRIVAARDDTRGLLVDGIVGPLTVTEGSYKKAVRHLDGAGKCHVVMSSTSGMMSDSPSKFYELSCGHCFEVDGLHKAVACPVCGRRVE